MLDNNQAVVPIKMKDPKLEQIHLHHHKLNKLELVEGLEKEK
jgi:hypothetical protein